MECLILVGIWRGMYNVLMLIVYTRPHTCVCNYITSPCNLLYVYTGGISMAPVLVYSLGLLTMTIYV